MPLYEYQCENCEFAQEELDTVPRAPRTCPSCGKQRAYKKIISMPSKAQLRGSMVPERPWRTRRGRGY